MGTLAWTVFILVVVVLSLTFAPNLCLGILIFIGMFADKKTTEGQRSGGGGSGGGGGGGGGDPHPPTQDHLALTIIATSPHDNSAHAIPSDGSQRSEAGSYSTSLSGSSSRSSSRSPSPSPSRWKYDAYLNFRGPDIRKGFVGHLHRALEIAWISVFEGMDELRHGEEISQQLKEVIEGSRISIAILSVDYASSEWCLNELVKMWECRKVKGQIIIPIFYDISPSDVKRQAGDFGEAFSLHETAGVDPETIETWRQALRRIGELKGYCANLYEGHEAQLIEEVALNVERSLRDPVVDPVVTDELVGIDHHVEEMMRKLGVVYSEGQATKVHGEDVRIVRIWGEPGVGKSTLAKVVFNRMHKLFEAHSFLEGISSKEVRFSQQRLIADLQQQEHVPLKSSDEGTEKIASLFREKKTVLIVLDDLDEDEKFNALAGKLTWLGPRSRIIVTTKKIEVLSAFDVGATVAEHKIEPMSDEHALYLFCKHAFQGAAVKDVSKYLGLSRDIVEAIRGIPRDIVRHASYLRDNMDIDIWKRTLESLQKHPKDRQALPPPVGAPAHPLAPTEMKISSSGGIVAGGSSGGIVAGGSSDGSSIDLVSLQKHPVDAPAPAGTKIGTPESSSTSLSSTRFKWDVYLNFRGTDTRTTITELLYRALVDAGISVVKDTDELCPGEKISQQLKEAIKESRIAIAILSTDYASSKRCLNELVQMWECRKVKGQTIIPIFYDISPSDVKRKAGDFGEAFSLHKTAEVDSDTIETWRQVLRKIGGLKGYSANLYKGYEEQLAEEVASRVAQKLRDEQAPGGAPPPLGDAPAPAVKKIRELGSSSTSLSSSSSRWKYDVYLNFRGTDIHKGFVGHLHRALANTGISVFKGIDELRPGEEISRQLKEAIKGSRIAIAIFSVDYASSKWCLHELVKMWKCRKKGQTIIPIFYDISPSDVKRQAGDFGEALSLHKTAGVYSETIETWRQALRQIGELKGYSANLYEGYEAQLAEEVALNVARRLRDDGLVVTDELVGIDHHVEEMMRKLGVVYSEGQATEVRGGDVRIIRIWGEPGVGKTTLAKVVFNQMRKLFEAYSFLEGISSKEVRFSQQMLIADLQQLGHVPLKSSDEGTEKIASLFREKKTVLIVLDNLDEDGKFNALAGKLTWLGPRSRIIVTTKKIEVLSAFDVGATVAEHKIEPMSDEHALYLFCEHAFQGAAVKDVSKYLGLSRDIVEAIRGIPRDIVRHASYLHDNMDIDIWKRTLESLQKHPKDRQARPPPVGAPAHPLAPTEMKISSSGGTASDSGSTDLESLQKHPVHAPAPAGTKIGTPESSSTSLSSSRFKWDVYLNFRGTDTPTTITDLLYRALVDAGISVFRDTDELCPGEEISQQLKEAIKGSRISIAILSTDYASSKWCLNELVQMWECREANGQTIIPIFYGISRSDVTDQAGDFGEAFSLHKTAEVDPETIKTWRQVLRKIGGLSDGYSANLYKGYEEQLAEEVASRVAQKLRDEQAPGGAPPPPGDASTTAALPPPGDAPAPVVDALPPAEEKIRELGSSGIKHEVFLSFRGSDTRRGFTDHLYHRLTVAGIRVFRDEECLVGGENIRQQLNEAIEGSRISIAILSQNFASSKWCLDDLVQMWKCREANGQTIIPIFYHISPSDVRHLAGSFGKAFDRHERAGRVDSNTIETWRQVLQQIGGLRGYSVDYKTSEGQLLEEVAELVVRILKDDGLRPKDGQAPGGAPAPLGDAPAPAVDAPAPLRDAPAPAVDAPAPAVDAPAPLGDAPAPAVDAPAPAVKKKRKLEPSSASSSSPGIERDVFLSFRSTNTCKIKDQLYRTLTDAGIRVFRCDNEHHFDEELWPQVKEAIERSRISIAILSADYVTSKSCLMELAQMWECRMSNGQNIIPIFYDISPSEVTDQAGDFGEAFVHKTAGVDSETIETWRTVLRHIGELAEYRADLCKGDEDQLARKVAVRVARMLRDDGLAVTDKLVGIDHHVQEIKRKLGVANIDEQAIEVRKEDVHVVGICGVRGVGKTILAKVVFNQMRDFFDACSFLQDISSKEVEFSRSMLIADLQVQNRAPVESSSEGTEEIASLCHNAKVLVVLDDVDKDEQIKALAGKLTWFGPGSKIIVTTTKKEVLSAFDVGEADHGTVEEHKVELMSPEHALQLFRNHAFQGDAPEDGSEYDSLSRDFVKAIRPLPSAIESRASTLRHMNIDEWRNTLDLLQKARKR